jgi:hypothetical protein
MQKPGPTAQVALASIKWSAESAEFKSVPNITLVIFNLVALEKLPILILKRHPAMMLFLSLDVAFESFHI